MTHKVHMQYMQRWYRLYSQASEQSSDTSVINWQLIITDSTSNVTVLSGKQSDNVLIQVDVSDVTVRL